MLAFAPIGMLQQLKSCWQPHDRGDPIADTDANSNSNTDADAAVGSNPRRRGRWRADVDLARSRFALQLLLLALFLLDIGVVTVNGEDARGLVVWHTAGYPLRLPCSFPADRVTDLSKAIGGYWELYDYYDHKSVNVTDTHRGARCNVTASPELALDCNTTDYDDEQYYRCVAVFPPIAGTYQRTHGAWVFVRILSAPEIISMRRSTEAVWLGKETTVTCLVSCSETPNTTIYVDGLPVKYGEDRRVEVNLVVDRLRTVTCFTEAQMKSGYHNATRTVTYVPYVPGATIRNDQCVTYSNNGLCARHLLGTNVTVQDQNYLNRTENLLTTAMRIIDDMNRTNSSSCSRELLERFLCNFYFVSCAANSSELAFPFLPPCREYCSLIVNTMCSAEISAITAVFKKQLPEGVTADTVTSSEDYVWWQPVVYFAAQQSVLAKGLNDSSLAQRQDFAPDCSILSVGDMNRKRPPPYGVNLFARCSRLNFTDFSTARWDSGQPVYTDSCYYGKGAFYNGPMNRSKAGECSDWSALSESNDSFVASITPFVFGELRQRACRNPGGIFARPMCVRKKKNMNTTLQECDVPQCVFTSPSPQTSTTSSPEKRPIDHSIREITSRPSANVTGEPGALLDASHNVQMYIIVIGVAVGVIVLVTLVTVLACKLKHTRAKRLRAPSENVRVNGRSSLTGTSASPGSARPSTNGRSLIDPAKPSGPTPSQSNSTAISLLPQTISGYSIATTAANGEQIQMKRLMRGISSGRDRTTSSSHSRTARDDDDDGSGSENGSEDVDEYDEADERGSEKDFEQSSGSHLDRLKTRSDRPSNATTDKNSRLENKMRKNKSYHKLSSLSPLGGKLRHLEYPRNQIIYLEDIGVGAFGQVFKALAPSIAPPEKYTTIAVKALRTDCTREMQRDFEREALLLAELHHHNVVRILGVCSVGRPLCILLEYMPSGDLNTFLQKRAPASAGASANDSPVKAKSGQLPPSASASSINFASDEEGSRSRIALMNDLAAGESQREPRSGAAHLPHPNLSVVDLLGIARQVACGMTYIADRGFIHRDLATRNCLVGENLVVKIADFGLMRKLRRGNFYYQGKENEAVAIRWTPLESLINNIFTRQSDCWSFGVVLWEIFSYGQQAYPNMTHEEVIEFVHAGGRLDPPSNAPEPVCAMMRKCWSENPYHRPSFNLLDTQLTDLYMFYLRKKEEDDRRERERERELLAIQRRTYLDLQLHSQMGERSFPGGRNSLLEPLAVSNRAIERPNIVELDHDGQHESESNNNISNSGFTNANLPPPQVQPAQHIYYNLQDVAKLLPPSNSVAQSNPQASARTSAVPYVTPGMAMPRLPPKKSKPPPPLRLASISSTSTPVRHAGQVASTPTPTSPSRLPMLGLPPMPPPQIPAGTTVGLMPTVPQFVRSDSRPRDTVVEQPPVHMSTRKPKQRGDDVEVTYAASPQTSATWSMVSSEPGNERPLVAAMAANDTRAEDSVSLETDVNRRLLSAADPQDDADDEGDRLTSLAHAR